MRLGNPGGQRVRGRIILLSILLMLGCISTHMVPVDAASVGRLPAATPLVVHLCSPRDVGAISPARGLQLSPRVTTVSGAFARAANDTIVLTNPRLTQIDSAGLNPRTANIAPDVEVVIALAEQCGVQREQIHAAETAGRTAVGLYLSVVTLSVLGIAVIFLIMNAQGTNIGP